MLFVSRSKISWFRLEEWKIIRSSVGVAVRISLVPQSAMEGVECGNLEGVVSRQEAKS